MNATSATARKKTKGRRKLRPMHLFLLFLILAVPGYWVVNSLLGYSTIDTSSGLALLNAALRGSSASPLLTATR